MLVPEDEPSRKGKFGWELACYTQNGKKIHVPYVFRTSSTHTERRFVPFPFLDATIDCHFNSVRHHLIGLEMKIAVPSFFPTPDECILLNSINKEHCKSFYGCDIGIEDGILIEVADAVEILKFLSTSRVITSPNSFNPVHYNVSFLTFFRLRKADLFRRNSLQPVDLADPFEPVDGLGFRLLSTILCPEIFTS